MWLARDESGALYAYSRKPFKFLNGGYWDDGRVFFSEDNKLKQEIFPSISWKDKEPTWVRFIRKDWFYVDSKGC